ncbi:hypothetical protein ERUR111494_03510 [Erysipelothrix urinaevulpis]|uniref:hypothetical protein n=1 Tax=Erysipelothrix urinaevulpis TaxID=2683717 RepID=UPI00135C00FB|nr:hypothetical protein [Erysipelothrix urinaevulpis]
MKPIFAFQSDKGKLKSNTHTTGRYGSYRASYNGKKNKGKTSATWHNGGGGTVYIKMSTRKEVKSSGGQLTGPTEITDYGVKVQYHKYFGGPMY